MAGKKAKEGRGLGGLSRGRGEAMIDKKGRDGLITLPCRCQGSKGGVPWDPPPLCALHPPIEPCGVGGLSRKKNTGGGTARGTNAE